MDVIAHRGFAEEGVENARSRLVAAAATADAVEFDVRIAGDGVPVVHHDETVDRLTGATGPVDGYTADELESLSLAGTDEGIPRLATILDQVTGPINPEIKVETGLERIFAGLDAYDGRVLVSSFRSRVVERVPGPLRRALLVAPPVGSDPPSDAITDVGAAVEFVSGIAGDAVHPHVAACLPDAVRKAHAAGLAVNAWTISSRTTATAMRRAGVDGVIADSPRYVRDA